MNNHSIHSIAKHHFANTLKLICDPTIFCVYTFDAKITYSGAPHDDDNPFCQNRCTAKSSSCGKRIPHWNALKTG